MGWEACMSSRCASIAGGDTDTLEPTNTDEVPPATGVTSAEATGTGLTDTLATTVGAGTKMRRQGDIATATATTTDGTGPDTALAPTTTPTGTGTGPGGPGSGYVSSACSAASFLPLSFNPVLARFLFRQWL